ncbi:hypothetical protein QW060_19610 [Myroides ceti]|uniref:Maturase K n=1 Tax=Paenimyroides ceti TaxID=395087 RepID=A0ABT8CXF7_9FLAO|nr:hypothetical protein [Paenimyroides ceti]MDN3709233.1 hypothetical protein [Paenimyroides ceti]
MRFRIYSSQYQSRILSSLKSFFDFLLLEKYIVKHPVIFIELPRQGRKLS